MGRVGLVRDVEEQLERTIALGTMAINQPAHSAINKGARQQRSHQELGQGALFTVRLPLGRRPGTHG